MWIDDDILRRCDEDLALALWCPDSTMVVLGSANQADSEVDVANCEADTIPILKRYGGGGTVVLHPGCVVISLGCWVRQHFQNQLYFQALNAAVLAALRQAWPQLGVLSQNGISDLACGPRKVGGTSLFRSRNYLLYQASLLVDPRIELIERYLRHPTKEPGYRGGRSHREFVQGIADLVTSVALDAGAVEVALTQGLERTVRDHLAGELSTPMPEQFAALRRRCGP